MNNSEQMIEQKGYYAATIHGVSMTPLLRNHRDSVCVVKTDAYKKYDVVLFRRKGGQLVLHRVIGEKDGLLIIRGDNELAKELVRPEQCVGVMKQFTRKNKVYAADHLGYRLYSRIWSSTTLFRRTLHFLGRVKGLVRRCIR